MKWIKKGLIIKANGQREWMNSHIQNPYAVLMGDKIRIYFTTRPAPSNGLFKSVTAYLDLDKNDLAKVINISEEPILDFGNQGTFDEFGIMPGAVVKRTEKEYWLYYAGWKRTVSVPYDWSIGLAVSVDGGTTFSKYGEGPIMGVSYNDPYLLAAPRSVFIENDIWHMLYGSGTGWIFENGRAESMYLNRHAVSEDGINWKRDDNYCVDTVYEDESQSACCNIKIGNTYHMFFPYRHSTNFRNKQRGYLIGYAYSKDLKNWTRNDKSVGIGLSSEGWDSEMICYPHVIQIEDKIIMFYCGNAFGQGGLGYAELDIPRGGGIVQPRYKPDYTDKVYAAFF